MKSCVLISLLTLTLLSTGGIPTYRGAAAPSASQADSTALSSPIINPTPKWQGKGCFASWCQTGWYASPAVADLNGDGQPEVIWSPYSIFVVDGATGGPVWSVRAGHDSNTLIVKGQGIWLPALRR